MDSIRTQTWELWQRDHQTLTVLSWTRDLSFKLNRILKTYPDRPEFEEGAEVMFRCDIKDLGKISKLLKLDEEYIRGRLAC